MIQIWNRSIRGLAILVFFCSSSGAQSTQQDFEWAWKDALETELPRGTHASWIEVVYPQMSGTEARALLSRIGDDPDHPERGEAEQALWLEKSGELISTFKIWYLDETHYRVNEDTPQAEWSPHVDAVVNGSDGWIRGANGVLTALDLRISPRMRDSRSYKSRINSFVTNFVNAGMGRYSDHEIQSFESTEDRWGAVLRGTKDASKIELQGRYMAENEQFIVEEAKYYRDVEDKNPVRIVSVDFEMASHLQRFMPSTVQIIGRDGRVDREYRYRSMEGFDPRDFDQYARLPDLEHPDPLRPDIQLRRIDDFRTKVAVRTEVDPASGNQTREFISDDRVFASRFGWNVVGWLLAGVLVVALVIVRFWKPGS